MRYTHGFTAATLAAALLLVASPFSHAQYGPPPGPPQAYQGQGGWDGPPQEFSEIKRRGFHDGIEGARKDYENHRPPNANNRDEFRHPDVPRELRGDYRDGFRRGYDAGMRHLMGGGPGPR